MFKNIPEIMTFAESKDSLKVGKNTLLDLLHSGQLEGFKIKIVGGASPKRL